MNVYLDIFGTILALDDVTYRYPARLGLDELAKRATIIGISETGIVDAENALAQMYENTEYPIDPVDFIDEFVQLRPIPNISSITANPKDLVIGCSDNIITGAKLAGCRYIRVPPYRIGSDENDMWELVKHMF